MMVSKVQVWVASMMIGGAVLTSTVGYVAVSAQSTNPKKGPGVPAGPAGFPEVPGGALPAVDPGLPLPEPGVAAGGDADAGGMPFEFHEVWQYKVLRFIDLDETNHEKQLNLHGKKGWEIASIQSIVPNNSRPVTMVYLKRHAPIAMEPGQPGVEPGFPGMRPGGPGIPAGAPGGLTGAGAGAGMMPRGFSGGGLTAPSRESQPGMSSAKATTRAVEKDYVKSTYKLLYAVKSSESVGLDGTPNYELLTEEGAIITISPTNTRVLSADAQFQGDADKLFQVKPGAQFEIYSRRNANKGDPVLIVNFLQAIK